MIKARPKYPMDLYDNIYIDNIQKAIVICLIIHSDNISFWCWIYCKVFDKKNTRMYDVTLSTLIKVGKNLVEIDQLLTNCFYTKDFFHCTSQYEIYIKWWRAQTMFITEGPVVYIYIWKLNPAVLELDFFELTIFSSSLTES